MSSTKQAGYQVVRFVKLPISPTWIPGWMDNAYTNVGRTQKLGSKSFEISNSK